jgi:uncharacterized membrane protein (GlpM family)
VEPVVVAKRQGFSNAAIGGLLAVFGGFPVLGPLLSPIARRLFSLRTIILVELWAALGCGVFLVWPSVWALVWSQRLRPSSDGRRLFGY